ncbi:MAG: DNA adenine methylase [Planctomycetes bacterium]|nr:DNA adenine methylase [Planctomycetota bacterium]
MGVKTRLTAEIQAAVARACPRAGSVLDLMSGTAVVAQTLAATHRVVANDVQAYAAAIARAYLVHTDPVRLARALDVERDLGAAYRSNHAALLERLTPAVALEDAFVEAHGLAPDAADPHAGPVFPAPSAPADLARARRGLPRDPAGLAAAYRAFALQGTPAFGEVADAAVVDGPFRGAADLFARATVEARRADPRLRPYLLATVYYPNVYFGLRQAIAVDSLRCAIDALEGPLAREKRAHYLAALLHAVSVSTSATSHFCQPRGLSSDAEVHAVLARRALSVPSRLAAYSREIAATCAATRYRPGNAVLSEDWRAVLGPRWGDVQADVVYADPPYTADHYSRFYHALEVLTRYDYPVLKTVDGRLTKGRYPALGARHRSGFCVRRQVEAEVADLVRLTAARGAALVLSYGEENGLLLRTWRDAGCSRAEALRRLERLAAASYGDVSLERKPLLHSGQGDSNHTVTELLLVARRPRSARRRARRGAPACA